MAKRGTPEERFLRYVDKTPECWLWTGGVFPSGYGAFEAKRGGVWRAWRAHRWAYEHWVGVVPDGLVLDHLCGVPACVRPGHLEAVTQRINVMRGRGLTAKNLAKTHCKHNHEFTPENTIRRPSRPHHRDCRECSNARRRKSHV